MGVEEPGKCPLHLRTTLSLFSPPPGFVAQPKNDKLVLVHGIHTQPLENPHMDWMDQATTLSREERARLAKERHKALFSHYEKRCKEADVRSPPQCHIMPSIGHCSQMPLCVCSACARLRRSSSEAMASWPTTSARWLRRIVPPLSSPAREAWACTTASCWVRPTISFVCLALKV